MFQESYDTFKEIIIKQIVAQRGNRSSSLRGSSVPRRFDGRSIVSRTIFGGELKHVGTLEGVGLSLKLNKGAHSLAAEMEIVVVCTEIVVVVLAVAVVIVK